jgi:hypothetical protein
MFISGIIAAAAAAKWLVAAKIVTPIGTVCMTAAPVIDRWLDEED